MFVILTMVTSRVSLVPVRRSHRTTRLAAPRLEAWCAARRARNSPHSPSVLTPVGSRTRSSSRLSRTQVLLNTALLGQQDSGAGTSGGPSTVPLSSSRQSPHGPHPPVRHVSFGARIHTCPNKHRLVRDYSTMYLMVEHYVYCLVNNTVTVTPIFFHSENLN